MKKIYTVKLNDHNLFMVQEEDNTIGLLYQSLHDAKQARAETYGIVVGMEALSYGKSLGFITNKEEIAND